MDNIKIELLQAVMRLRKSYTSVSSDLGVPIGELLILRNIESSYKERGNVYVSELLGVLPISKPAVSQILNSLEKKGQIKRSIGATDHRKISLKLTAKGEAHLKVMEHQMDSFLSDVIERIGETNVEETLTLINLLVDTTEEMREEAEEAS